ncbi:MAG: glycosyltransferase [Acidobacteria bacterium]|nr:glycosyltransferase [Acidobacteriota bacterium]
MKLAVVVQRYGAEINGGAELHARYIAERLARHADVEVLTTCARDYVTWRNEYQPGAESVNGLTVRRFPVSQPRSPGDFGRLSELVFTRRHSLRDELKWLSAEGPTSPALVEHLRLHGHDYDYCLFFSYRYYHAYHGIRAVGHRALLVPTAERDPALGLAIFGPTFRGVRAIFYNSFEERALIQEISGNQAVPGVVVGVGSQIPPQASVRRFRDETGIRRRFALYVGRIDENKGCAELFSHYQRYAAGGGRLELVLAGAPIMPVPEHPRIHSLGFVPDQKKYDALAAADLLIMPSQYESLSMVTLEAWAMGLPVLVNGGCEVLHGQALRSNAGLYYASYEEFAETMRLLESNRRLRTGLGANGRRYFRQHYAWPVIEQKYLEMLQQLQRDGEPAVGGAIEPLPGWFGRRRRLPAAQEVLARATRGPVMSDGTRRAAAGAGAG